MAAMTPQDVNPAAGLNPTFAAVTSSDTFPNDGKTSLHVANGSGSAVTATVVSQLTAADDADLGQVSLPNLTFTVPAGGRLHLPFLKPARFNDQSGNVTVNYSATTSVTAAAVRTQRPL